MDDFTGQQPLQAEWPSLIADNLTNGGNNLQSTLNLQFNSAWAGKTLRILMQGTNVNYVSGPWQEFGSFTVQ